MEYATNIKSIFLSEFLIGFENQFFFKFSFRDSFPELENFN